MLAGTGYTLEAVLPIPDLPRHVIPVRVHGPESFLLFAVWTQKEPTNVEPVLRAARCGLSFLQFGILPHNAWGRRFIPIYIPAIFLTGSRYS